jgi:two-component system, sensor histidine kinase and response regulator
LQAFAQHGLDALALLREGLQAGDPFDLALVDMKMPVMDGIELATQLRADPQLAGLRLVLVTSLHAADELARAREVGISAYLSKPVRRQELYRAMAQTVGDVPDVSAQAAASEQRLPVIRARVLMAEDNGVNQVVARNMLRTLGCEVHIVPNGQEAWAAVQGGGFDMVLMDCQMPVMDGYAASRAIRSWEAQAGAGARIPIVALTANALVGDAQTCLAAGMDDHLAKPYSRKQLAAAMTRWLPPHLVERGLDLPSEHERTVPLPLLDMDEASLDQTALDNIRALDDDGAVLAEVIQMYLDEAPAHLAALQQAQAQSDGAELGRIAHAFKSASYNVGAKPVAELCRQLERLGKAGERAGTPELVAQIQKQYFKLRPLLMAEMGQAA